MKTKRLEIVFAKAVSAVLLFVCSVFCFPSEAAAQKKTVKPAAPKTVIDYLKILPKSYSQIITANPSVDRLSLIKYDRRKSGFLRLEAKNFMGYAEIALFKKKSGSHLIAVNEYAQNSTCCDGGVAFYEYNKGRWKEVEALPRFSSGDLRTAFHGATGRQPSEDEMNEQVFELPRKGKEITLKIGGVPAMGFLWQADEFVSGMIYLQRAGDGKTNKK